MSRQVGNGDLGFSSPEAAALEQRLNFEMLLSELSARFSHLDEEDVDAEIERWLRRLIEVLGVDRSTLAELTPSGNMQVTHSCAVPGCQPYPPGAVNQTMPWLTQEFMSHRIVALARIPDDLPEHAVAERRYWAAAGLRAGIGIPITIGHSLACVLTFGSFRGPRDWDPMLISRLRLAGEVFGNAIVRRQSKQQLEQKQRELTHLGRVAVVSELASVIAHELDQPLTAVVSNAQAIRAMLESHPPDLAEADEALKDVIDAAMRISEIAQRERRLLRKSALNIAPLDINEAIREVELFIRADAKQDGARVAIDLTPSLPMVMADRIQLQQVILNLTRNGFQAMTEQPLEQRELRITTSPGADEIVLSIMDSGPPIDDALLAQMFQPFYTTKRNGLGMGLSISKSIVETHHGRIWPTRNAGAGLTMHIALPQARTPHVSH